MGLNRREFQDLGRAVYYPRVTLLLPFSVGFVLDFYSNTTAEEFSSKILEASHVFFSPAARGLLMQFTLYSKDTDWWLYSYAIYEYGVNNRVSLGEFRSYHFRPHVSEKNY